MATIPEITADIKKFADERDWAQFHTVRNIVLALVGEVGELAAELQWVNDADVSVYLEDSAKKSRVASEIADIATYLFRLCDIANIDLSEEIGNKLILNRERYPIEKSKGSSSKYTEWS